MRVKFKVTKTVQGHKTFICQLFDSFGDIVAQETSEFAQFNELFFGEHFNFPKVNIVGIDDVVATPWLLEVKE